MCGLVERSALPFETASKEGFQVERGMADHHEEYLTLLTTDPNFR